MITIQEKLHCPFCGSNSIVTEMHQVTGHSIYNVKCNVCGSCGPQGTSEEKANNLWNQRVRN